MRYSEMAKYAHKDEFVAKLMITVILKIAEKILNDAAISEVADEVFGNFSATSFKKITVISSLLPLGNRLRIKQSK